MLYYEISGSGTPVVFLHGFMESTTMWNVVKQIPGVRAISIDLNGHGKSGLSHPHSPFPSIELMAAEVVEVLNELNFPAVQLVGHSLGGYVALEVFKLIPNHIEHITLFHSHPWKDSEEKQLDRERVAELVQTKTNIFVREAIPNLFYQPEKHRIAVEFYIELANQMKPQAIAWASRAMKNRSDNSDLLKNDPERFTIVQGKYDKLIPHDKIREFCSENEISFMALSNSGHMGHVEETERFLEVLETILIE